MSTQDAAPLVLLAAGGTGGHLFPAEALSAALTSRGVVVDLATDERATHYGTVFPARETYIIPSATVRGRDPLSLARTGATLALGLGRSLLLVRRIRPRAVVGFGGYPTVPPVLAAALSGIPTVIHDANAVIGRANRMLAPRVTAIATTFDGVLASVPALAAKATRTGNPLRPAVISAAALPYMAPRPGGLLRLLITGGSQGARIMSDIVPAAIERLEPALWSRLVVTQQARPEDVDRVKGAYGRLRVAAEVAPFFPDLPARIAGSHLVIARSGATTVAELAAIGRPSILVPLPHALDQDQRANAGVLEKAGGAISILQAKFMPDRLAAEISALASEPSRLEVMAQGARQVGNLDAADRLADLVLRVAGLP